MNKNSKTRTVQRRTHSLDHLTSLNVRSLCWNPATRTGKKTGGKNEYVVVYIDHDAPNTDNPITRWGISLQPITTEGGGLTSKNGRSFPFGGGFTSPSVGFPPPPAPPPSPIFRFIGVSVIKTPSQPTAMLKWHESARAARALDCPWGAVTRLVLEVTPCR